MSSISSLWHDKREMIVARIGKKERNSLSKPYDNLIVTRSRREELNSIIQVA